MNILLFPYQRDGVVVDPFIVVGVARHLRASCHFAIGKLVKQFLILGWSRNITCHLSPLGGIES